MMFFLKESSTCSRAPNKALFPGGGWHRGGTLRFP